MIRFFLKILKLAIFASVFFAFAFILFFAEPEKNTPIVEKEPQILTIPEFSGEQEIVFQWNFKGKSYSIKENFYQSAYDYYRRQNKTYVYYSEKIPTNWEEEYYGMFLKTAVNDETIKKLTTLLRQEGEKNNLDGDQIIDLALAFVQSISYDEKKAAVILNSEISENSTDHLPRYPYEVLFEKKGICSDKSFLALLIIRELGYGSAIFEYEAEKHMAVGVKCPTEHSTGKTGYCYAEVTTPGHRIGIVPYVKEGKAVLPKEINYYEEENSIESKQSSLENPKIYQITEGQTYLSITKTLALREKISQTEKALAALSEELEGMRKELDIIENKIKELDKKMREYRNDEKYEKYNDLVPKYNNLVKNYQQKIKNYNGKIKIYNTNVAQYNKMIKDYSVTE